MMNGNNMGHNKDWFDLLHKGILLKETSTIQVVVKRIKGSFAYPLDNHMIFNKILVCHSRGFYPYLILLDKLLNGLEPNKIDRLHSFI